MIFKIQIIDIADISRPYELKKNVFPKKFPKGIINFGSLCKEEDETTNVEDLLETLLKEENSETEDVLETLNKEGNNETEDLIEKLFKEENPEINGNVEEQLQVRNSFQYLFQYYVYLRCISDYWLGLKSTLLT